MAKMNDCNINNAQPQNGLAAPKASATKGAVQAPASYNSARTANQSLPPVKVSGARSAKPTSGSNARTAKPSGGSNARTARPRG